MDRITKSTPTGRGFGDKRPPKKLGAARWEADAWEGPGTDPGNEPEGGQYIRHQWEGKLPPELK